MRDFKFLTKDSGLLAKLAEKLHAINHLPRWVIFSIDVGTIIFSLLVTYFLMNIWGIKEFGSYNTYLTFGALILVMCFYLFVFKVSSGVVRHSSIRDIIKISLPTFSALLTILIINYTFYYFQGQYLQPEKKLIYDLPLFFSMLS